MRKSHLLGALCAVVLTALPLSTVHAITVHLEFEVSSFESGVPSGMPAPENPVIGSIWYQAASITADIDALTRIDLTIDGHIYTLAEVGYSIEGTSNPDQCIGGLTNICSVGPRSQDFFLRWDQDDLAFQKFAYSTATGDSWLALTADVFTITAVPLPAAFWLFGSGLLGLIGIARRKQAV